MSITAERYDRWKAPAEDGQVLIWPDPANLLSQTVENQQLFRSSDSVRIQNIPLPEVRRALRSWIGLEDENQPLFATGHQTELHHPGVWVKNALIDSAAARSGGQAFHFAVDTDDPKHLQIRWPGGSIPLTDDSNDAAEWSGLLDPPSPAHIRQIAETLDRAAAAWEFRPLLGEFLLSLHGSPWNQKTCPLR